MSSWHLQCNLCFFSFSRVPNHAQFTLSQGFVAKEFCQFSSKLSFHDPGRGCNATVEHTSFKTWRSWVWSYWVSTSSVLSYYPT